MSTITISAKDGGAFKAYIAMAAKLPAPAVVVIQEIFGVNQGLRDKCDWLAAQGFIAVCPDLFWRLEPGIELTDKTQEEWQRAFDLMNAFDVEKGIEDIAATEEFIKQHNDCTGKAGCIGYCLGGKLAYLAAARTNIDASVGYYGVGLADMLDEAQTIKEPLMLHIAGKDEYTPPEAQEKIINGLKNHPQVTTHLYPEMDHAFTRVGGAHYDKDEAKKADDRTIAFLKEALA